MNRAKQLYKKYLNRSATREEVEELFILLSDRTVFNQLHDLFEEEWESDDVTFTPDLLTWEQIQATRQQRSQGMTLNHVKKGKTVWYTGSWKWAAAAAVLLLMGMAIWLFLPTAEKIYQTGYGETLAITLDDGSKVTLNANSTMTWNREWRNNKERIAILEGEAFFDVSHHKLDQHNTGVHTDERMQLMPFRVITPGLTINVLGTTFNVSTRRQKTDVLLKSGKVLLTSNNHFADSDRRSRNINSKSRTTGTDSVILMPGEFVSYSGRTQSLDKSIETISSDQTSWAEGFLTFRGIALKVVLQDLEDIYGKTFIVKDTRLLERMVNLGMPYEDWETVSGLMTLSLEIEMIEDGDQVIVKNK